MSPQASTPKHVVSSPNPATLLRRDFAQALTPGAKGFFAQALTLVAQGSQALTLVAQRFYLVAQQFRALDVVEDGVCELCARRRYV